MWRWAFLVLTTSHSYSSTGMTTLVAAHALQGRPLSSPLWGSPEVVCKGSWSSALSLPVGHVGRSGACRRGPGPIRSRGPGSLKAAFNMNRRSLFSLRTAASQTVSHDKGDNPPCGVSYKGDCVPPVSATSGTGMAETVSQYEATFLPVEGSDVPGAPSDSLLPPRGFRDFPPSTFANHKHIFSVWCQVAEEFGFQEYKGPAVEHSVLYSSFPRVAAASASISETGAPEHANAASAPSGKVPPHIYRLQGNDTEALCLRPEMTPSLARMVLKEQLHRPSALARRWFSIERVWRHERPGLGRRREHFQWNLDIAFPSHPKQAGLSSMASSSESEGASGGGVNGIGARYEWPLSGIHLQEAAACATAELIAAAVRLFHHLGLTPADVRIRVGSRALLCDLLLAQKEVWLNGEKLRTVESDKQNRTAHSFLRSPASGNVSKAVFNYDVLSKKLMRALEVLDCADRRSAAETETALGQALEISRRAASCILERLRSFDVNSDAMAQDLAGSLHRLPVSVRNGICRKKLTEREGSHGTSLQEIPSSVQEINLLLRLLAEGYGVAEWIDVDLLVVRGLHYYTGLVFEAFDTEGSLRAVLGGGCYGEPRALAASTKTGIAVDVNHGNTGMGDSSAAIQQVKSGAALKENKRERSAGSVTGAGLGMGDCVLLELLQRKRLLPVGRTDLDVVVVLLHGNNEQRFPHKENIGGSCNLSLASTPISSAATFSVLQAAKAQRLCGALRSKGLRVELLLPPQRSERASIRHAKSLGAKAVIFVTALSNSRLSACQKEPSGCILAPRLTREYSRSAGSGFHVTFLEPCAAKCSIHCNKHRTSLRADLPGHVAVRKPPDHGASREGSTAKCIPCVIASLMNGLAMDGGP